MTNTARVIVYRDEAGEWRWHTKAANGQVIAASGEAFYSRLNALRAAVNANPGLPVVNQEATEYDDPPT